MPLKISFCGDTSLGEYYLARSQHKYPRAYQRLQQQPASFFSQVKPALAQSSEVIINLETVLSVLPGEPIAGKQYPGRDKPEVLLPLLQDLGVTAVMLANNHSMDFGSNALLDMIAQLQQAGIAVIGAGATAQQANTPYVITHPDHEGRNIYIFNMLFAGKRYRDYGFFASSANAGVADAQCESWPERIMQLKEQEPDATVILCPHWQGIDYLPVREVHQEWCREMAYAGADYIIAQGSHTTDAIEQFEQCTIFYSIGNFVFNSPGRYQKLQAASHSLIVSLNSQNTSWHCTAQQLLTDNKLTGFNVALSSAELPVQAQLYEFDEPEQTECLSIDNWLQQIRPDGIYFYRGDINAPCAGFSSSFHDARPDNFFVFRDSHWPRDVYHQQNRPVADIIRKATALGYRNFVIANELSEQVLQQLPDSNVLVIDNTFKLMCDAARFMRNYSGCRLVGVTGSAGKSSTVAMLRQALSQNTITGTLFFPAGDNRNLFQDSLHSLTKLQHADHAVLEVSASKKFSNSGFYVRPDIAIFTSLSQAHGQYLGHIADIAQTKSILFTDMPAGGVAIINADMPCLDFVLMAARQAQVKIVLYGESPQANVRLHSYQFSSGNVDISFMGQPFRYNMAQLGKHQVLNSMAVLIALWQLGMHWQQHAQYLQQFCPGAGRGQLISALIDGKAITILGESFNANPLSMAASLELLAEHKRQQGGRAIAVLADMLELGSQAASLHSALCDDVLNAGIDKVFLAGELMQHLWVALPATQQGAIVPASEALAATLKTELQSGDTVLFKGSAAMKLADVIAQLLKSNEAAHSEITV